MIGAFTGEKEGTSPDVRVSTKQRKNVVIGLSVNHIRIQSIRVRD